MIPEWPIRAEELRRRPGSVFAFGRSDGMARRLADVTIDLSLPVNGRVDDRVRASVSAMRDSVVSEIEWALRFSLVPDFADDEALVASLSSRSVGIALPLLTDAGTLAHAPLIALLLRRAEEFVLARRLAPEPGGIGLPVDHPDPGIAAAASSLRIAEARRLDRFGEPALLFDDLSAELAVWLVWRIAAALRHYLCVHHRIGEQRVDALLIDAATKLLAGHDEGAGIHATAERLGARLVAENQFGGTLLDDLLAGGQVVAFTAVLSSAAALPAEDSWYAIYEPAGGRLATLLRAAAVTRSTAANVLLRLMPPHADAATEIALFDACDAQTAHAALAWARAPLAYRAAVQALDTALALADATT